MCVLAISQNELFAIVSVLKAVVPLKKVFDFITIFLKKNCSQMCSHVRNSYDIRASATP